MPRADSPQQKHFLQIQDPESFLKLYKINCFSINVKQQNDSHSYLFCLIFLLEVETTAGSYLGLHH